ncbi:peroxisomal membrane protein PEX14-like [Ananas comosus]|uniref:Peroxisomal membrane protein PEX14 n=1 Tax=Ananas comosus TaxID=4615 RepID=A0A6P5FVT0_ANACO|nr:peroxisomal membrane protein PEX14-like [Ananas comosus]
MDQKSDAELSKQPNGDAKDANNESLEKSAFAILQPIREDQIENAVKFLSHPKVRGSPVVHRRSFLEQKGLTKEEIDEAFRRVPDPSSNASSVEATTATTVAQTKPSTVMQPQRTGQAPQSAAALVNGAQMAQQTTLSRFRWYHALIAAGVLASSGVGAVVLFKNIVVPRLKAWIRKTVAEGDESEKEDKHSPKLAEEAAEAAKAAASAAAVVAKASQELLSSKNEERKYFEAFMGALDVQVKEMKSMSEALRKLESRKEDSFSREKLTEEYMQSTTRNGPVSNLWGNSQIMTTGQRGEKPPGYKTWDATQYTQQRPPSFAQESYSSSSQLNGSNYTHDFYSEPWLKKSTGKVTEIEPETVKATNERAGRGWVPPQPPSVVMPEAAAAIRQPKSSVLKQRSVDERSVESSSDGEEGVRKKAESSVEAGASSSAAVDASRSEIEEERSDAIEVN